VSLLRLEMLIYLACVGPARPRERMNLLETVEHPHEQNTLAAEAPVCVNTPAHTEKMLSGEQYTLRFGLTRLWHPQHDYLFAVILENGMLAWASIYDQLTEDQLRSEANLHCHINNCFRTPGTE
jgi:hypothetical protein